MNYSVIYYSLVWAVTSESLLLEGICSLVRRYRGEAVSVVLVQLPRVLLEVKVAAEPLLTDLAREWLLLIVRVHVEGQVIDLK